MQDFLISISCKQQSKYNIIDLDTFSHTQKK